MMMRTLAMICACAVSAMAFADEPEYPEVAYPQLPETAASADAFVPKDWRLEVVQRGDLNKDKRDDLVMVMRMQLASNIVQNEGLGVSEFDTNPRMLVVAFAEGSGYRRVLENHTLIPRPDNPAMDDYLSDGDGIIVRRGAFTVSLHSWASAGSWYTSEITFTFRHQNGCFRLIGYDSTETHRGSGEVTTTSANYVTGKATVALSNFTSDDPPVTQSAAVRLKTLPCLQDIGDGFGLDAGIEVPGGMQP